MDSNKKNDQHRNENLSRENLKEDVAGQRPWNDRSGSTSLDEKSSGVGRRSKDTGLATKDGTTGSDLDGQVG